MKTTEIFKLSPEGLEIDKALAQEAAERFSDTSWRIHRQWRDDRQQPQPQTIPIEIKPKIPTQRIEKRVHVNGASVDNDVNYAVVEFASNGPKPKAMHSHDEVDRNGRRLPQQMMLATSSAHPHHHQHGSLSTLQDSPALTSQPRSRHRQQDSPMDLSYITERIIALWFPAAVPSTSYSQGQRQAAHMLHSKHGDNYMLFNLCEPRRAVRVEHRHVKEVGWPPRLAPPLERLCSVCKDIDSWLSGDKHRIAVLHARGSKDRLGVVVAAYMHYSSICGTADQALDRFSMRRFLDESIGPMDLPSNKRYVDYFSGLLSGNIRINAAPLYLTHVTVLGAPMFENQGGCKAFLKIYEGLVPVYTSGVYNVSSGARQFTVNVAGEQRRGLRLRGDILVKCYHRAPATRENIFSCQFHTCAVADYTLSFTRPELDSACTDHRFPMDGAVELHFSPTPEVRQPTPAPTPAVPCVLAEDPITRFDSFENLQENVDDSDQEDGQNHTFGPLDGSIYATIAKKPELSPGAVSSPLTVSMDSGISSAGHHQNNPHTTTSSNSPPLTTSQPSPLTPEEQHRELDELLSDMLLTVESIPDISAKPRLQSQQTQMIHQVHHQNHGINHQNQPVHHQINNVQHLVGGALPTQTMKAREGVVYSNGKTEIQSTTVDRPVRLLSDSGALDHVSYIDDDDPLDEEIPYHARQDSRPFTYGSVAENTDDEDTSLSTSGNMITAQKGLASPSLVRKASFNRSSGDTLKKVQTQVYNPDPIYSELEKPYKKDPIEDIFTRSANESYRREYGEEIFKDEYKRYEPLKRSYTEGTLRRSPEKQQTVIYKTSQSTVTSPYSDSESLSPPSGYRNSPRSPEFHESYTTGSNLTWLQRQQQKLKERRDMQRREERQNHETRLISELRNVQSRHMRPTASHRLDGYTSDTTAFADDDDDFTIPLHINTAAKTNHITETESPMLPNRTSSRKYTTNSAGYMTQPRRENERPFMAVKRAHEEARKYTTLQGPLESGAATLVRPANRGGDTVDASGLLSVVEQEQTATRYAVTNSTSSPSNNNGGSGNGPGPLYREDSVSSWRTTSVSEAEGSPPQSVSPRPQTPAFPVMPRTPYGNSTPYGNNTPTPTILDMSSERLPPKSPTTQRRLSYPSTTTNKNTIRWSNSQDSASKDFQGSPLTNGNNSEYNLHQTTTITTQQRNTNAYNDTYQQQHSPKSPAFNGSTSPTVYYGSRRSSVHSNSEPPQEVSPAHVKFVRDTSKYWYKPTISREEAISLLRDQQPGTFVVRDSNSFPGAFGMALKVSTAPANVQQKQSNGDELVRHFLIEPTSRGVRLKGCPNEPVFSSLSALVYQHSITQMALPCRLLLPESDVRQSETSTSQTTTQLLLSQGAACNVLLLATIDMESLTGPQAIKKAVMQLFKQNPLPKETLVHFKVSGQGITLTDNKRKLFFRRHYNIINISYCGLDPDEHRWSSSADDSNAPSSLNRIFGFVAKKPTSSTDNQCHIFAELEPDQPATAIVNFANKIINTSTIQKSNIV